MSATPKAVESEEPISERVAGLLKEAKEPMTLEQICVAIHGRQVGARERANVYQILHRLTEKDLITRMPYRWVWTIDMWHGPKNKEKRTP